MSIEALTWALNSTKATLAARLVLFSLADHAHPDGTMSFPSVGTMARHALVSERTVRRSLRELEEMGEITATGKTKAGVTIYAVGGANLSPNLVKDGSRTVRGTSATPDPHEMSPQSGNLASLRCEVCGRDFNDTQGGRVKHADHLYNAHGIGDGGAELEDDRAA